MAALVLIGLPVVLLCLGVPIFVALIAAASIGIVAMNIGSMAPVHVALFGGLDNFPLLAVPLFIFAGEVMGRGGIARRLVEWALSIVGGVRGSLALATVASSELFGSMSGSSVGCVAAIGRLMVPELTRRGYTAPFAGSLIASCGAIATIIPPSITMIIFGIAAQQSVPKLFLAGIVPGLLIGVLVSIYLLVYARVQMIPLTASTRWKNILASTRDAGWALFAPVVILGGIYGGIFTPTEAAGIACIYAILVARFIYNEMSWTELWQTAVESAKVISQILIIVSAAGAYSWLITTSGFPTKLVGTIAGLQVAAAADHQYRAAVRGDRARAPGRDPDPDAAVDAADRAGRRKRDPFRHHLHREPGGRDVHPAVRAQSLCHPRIVRHPAQQALSRHPAVHCGLSDRARADHLRSRDHAGAAAAVAVSASHPACCVGAGAA
jgi:C4-dicarboxylate transporter, DctM subunit